ncbi:hypothetical protein MAR_026176 [Mya arenaria]|uniref:Uncharacterized protein n=1 Tax=Mya arenaria TaxID=6604 RepID=A0ABY7EXU2_MYAAR|nr:hypothetical protein MAR_026176 [Mya arenaria]
MELANPVPANIIPFGPDFCRKDKDTHSINCPKYLVFVEAHFEALKETDRIVGNIYDAMPPVSIYTYVLGLSITSTTRGFLWVIMANASLGNDSVEKDSLSLVEIEENEFDTESGRSHVSQKKYSCSPRASKKELDSLSMVDTAGSTRQRPVTSATTCTVTDSTAPKRVATLMRIRLSPIQDTVFTHDVDDDTLSLMPGQRERAQFLGEDAASETNTRKSHTVLIDSDSEDRFLKYSSKTCYVLQEIVGADATTKSDKNNNGISLDDSQISVLNESWRREKPTKLSAYKDSYRSDFPISDKAEDILAAPIIESIVGNLLLKKFGQKFAEIGTNGKCQVLQTNTRKDLVSVERPQRLYRSQALSYGLHPARTDYKAQSQTRFPKATTTKSSGVGSTFRNSKFLTIDKTRDTSRGRIRFFANQWETITNDQ